MAESKEKRQKIEKAQFAELDKQLHAMKAAGAPIKTSSSVSQSEYLRSRADMIQELKDLGFSNRDIAEGLKLGEKEVFSASTISYATRQAVEQPKPRKKASRKTSDAGAKQQGDAGSEQQTEQPNESQRTAGVQPAGSKAEETVGSGKSDSDQAGESVTKRVMRGGAERHESGENPFAQSN